MTDTQPYRPSCGSEGADFMAAWCDRCERDAAFREDRGDSCPIAVATMVYRETDPDYPPEWRITNGRPHCTAFAPVDPTDQPIDPDAVVRNLI